MSLKVAVGVLILLVVVFVVAVGVGVNREDPPGSDGGGFVQLLENRVHPPLVARADVESDCFDPDAPDTLAFSSGLGGGCTLRVVGADSIRFVELRSAQPFAIEAPAPTVGDDDLDFEVTEEVAANKLVQVAVGKAAEGERFVEIDLECATQEPCRVSVRTSD